MIPGIALGLTAALFQSLSYLASRRFAGKFESSTLNLLTHGHIIMGIFSAAIVLPAWPRSMPPAATFLPVLLLAVASYLTGQAALFFALKHADASRVSPLLGLKIIILALISVTLLSQHLAAPQWAAVALGVVAAAMLSQSGGTMTRQSLLWIVVACVGYSISDLSIKVLVGRFMYLGLAHSSIFSVVLCYLACGAVGVAALPFLPRHQGIAPWSGALPFAVTWYVSMLFLFACFGSIGVVFGNIIQSSRGVISIVLGALVAGAGYEHLEKKAGARIVIVRAGAALLMTASIALFTLGK